MSNTRKTRKFSYLGKDGMGGGLSSENPVAVSQNKMVIADNILIGTNLTRRKRGGQEKYHTGTFDQTSSYPVNGSGAGLPIRGIIEYWRTASMAGNPVSDIFLHQDNKVWSIDDRNTPAVDRTGALTLDIESVPSYQVFDGVLYFCSTTSSDGYNKWDGANAVAIAATPPPDGAGKYITAHLGRMIMAGNTDFPYRVYFSSALAPEEWSDTPPFDGTSLDLVDDGDPEGITGLASFQNRLYVWTRQSLYEITGTTPDTFIVQKVSSGIGCISHASIAQVPNDVLFASDRGVHSLRQLSSGRQTEINFASIDIQRLWTELLSTSLYMRCMAMYDDTINSYIVSVPSAGQIKNDQLLVYNIEFGTWTVWPNVNARSLCRVLISNKRNILLGKEDGVIAMINRTSRNDFGGGYSARFRTGVLYPGGDLTSERRFCGITVLVSTTTPSTIQVSWTIDGKKSSSKSVDLSAGTDLLGSTFVLGQSKLGIGQYLPVSIGIDDIGYGIQIEVTCGGTGDMEFYGFILEVEDVNQSYGSAN